MVVIKKVSELKEKILHRDISVGNVMFEEVEGEIIGILGDWDHATETVPGASYKRQSFRTVRRITSLYLARIYVAHYFVRRVPGHSCQLQCSMILKRSTKFSTT